VTRRLRRMRSGLAVGWPMTTSEVSPTGGRRKDAATVRARWGWTLGLGVVLIACGIGAIALPVAADFTVGPLLGAVFVIAGVAKIVQGLNCQEWKGANWYILLGAAEVVGGILIYLNPLKGALALTLLLAVMFLIEAVMQVALAVRVRPEPGWGWLFLAGLVALGASIGLTRTARYTQYYTPGTLAGIAFLAAGWACVAMALAKRRVPR
jgi:uncharacterized membrane protein HdeD (DUF308 family)